MFVYFVVIRDVFFFLPNSLLQKLKPSNKVSLLLKLPQQIRIKQFKVSLKWTLAAVIVRTSFSFCVAVEIFIELAPLKATARLPPSSVSLAARDDWHSEASTGPSLSSALLSSPLLTWAPIASLSNFLQREGCSARSAQPENGNPLDLSVPSFLSFPLPHTDSSLTELPRKWR